MLKAQICYNTTMNALTSTQIKKKKKRNPSQPSIKKKKHYFFIFKFFFFGKWLHLNVLRNYDFVYL